MPESDRENDSRDHRHSSNTSRDTKHRSDHDKHDKHSSRSSRSSRSHSDRSERHRRERSDRSDRHRSSRSSRERSSRDRSRSRESRRSGRSRRDRSRDRRDRSRESRRSRDKDARDSPRSRDEKSEASGQWVVDESEDEESRDVKQTAGHVTDAPHVTSAHVTTRNDDINTLNQQIAGDLRKKLLEKKSDHVTESAESENDDSSEKADSAKAESSITLSAMDTQMMHSTTPSNPEDMTIAEMLAEERRLSHLGNASSRAAETISRDKAFSTDETYADDNSSRLASLVNKKQIDLKNMAVSQVQKMTKALDECSLCAEDRAPKTSVISTGTRVYLSISSSPELSSFSCAIVPISHHKNTLSCDSDEWEEIRNFQKCLAVMFHSMNKGVCFYENAARPWELPHAHIVCIPVPLELTNDITPFFQEAFLTSDTEWSQHRKVIVTSGKGKHGFQTSIAKEAPYVHVWTTIDGGLGHIVEDEKMWPKGDRFCREVLAGLLRCPPELAKRKIEWVEDKEKRGRFVERWRGFDWTRQLTES